MKSKTLCWLFKRLPILQAATLLVQCGIYSFTGASIPPGTNTFQVNYFENLAGNRPGSTVEPGLDRDFTLALQDLLLNQTNLSLVNNNGDLVYEGEIKSLKHSGIEPKTLKLFHAF